MKKTLRIIGIGVWYLSSLNYFFFQFQNVLWYQRFLCAFFIWLALNFTFYSWLISPIFCSFLCIKDFFTASANSRSFIRLQQLFMSYVQLIIDVTDLAKFEIKLPW